MHVLQVVKFSVRPDVKDLPTFSAVKDVHTVYEKLEAKNGLKVRLHKFGKSKNA